MDSYTLSLVVIIFLFIGGYYFLVVSRALFGNYHTSCFITPPSPTAGKTQVR